VTRRTLAPIIATAANAANTANRGANPSASLPTTASPPRGLRKKGLSRNGDNRWQGTLRWQGETMTLGTFDNEEEGFRSYDRMLISFESNHIFIKKGYRLNYHISIYEAEMDDLEHLAKDLTDENAIRKRLVELDTAWRGRQRA